MCLFTQSAYFTQLEKTSNEEIGSSKPCEVSGDKPCKIEIVSKKGDMMMDHMQAGVLHEKRPGN